MTRAEVEALFKVYADRRWPNGFPSDGYSAEAHQRSWVDGFATGVQLVLESTKPASKRPVTKEPPNTVQSDTMFVYADRQAGIKRRPQNMGESTFDAAAEMESLVQPASAPSYDPPASPPPSYDPPAPSPSSPSSSHHGSSGNGGDSGGGGGGGGGE